MICSNGLNGLNASAGMPVSATVGVFGGATPPGRWEHGAGYKIVPWPGISKGPVAAWRKFVMRLYVGIIKVAVNPELIITDLIARKPHNRPSVPGFGKEPEKALKLKPGSKPKTLRTRLGAVERNCLPELIRS